MKLLKKKKYLIIITLLLNLNINSQTFPPDNWKETPSPLSSDLAEKGGKIRVYASQYPKSFNYLLDSNVLSGNIFQRLFETLLSTDPITLENRPLLADKWTISPDKKTFTFFLSSKAKWSDGTPITAKDVIWSFNAIKNPKNFTGSLQTILKRLTSIEEIDEKTVRIKSDEVHWKNLLACSSFQILPKLWWEKQDFNKVNFEFPIVSGPYKLGENLEQHYLRLERRDDYWRNDFPSIENIYNFKTIEYRFYSQRNMAYEAFKKNEIDLFSVYTSSRWIKETNEKQFNKNWIIKQSIYNKNPVGFQGFAINMRKPLFKDNRVRKALAHLLDRNRMNKTLMFNQYNLTHSYWPDIWSDKNPCPNKEIVFDKNKAIKLLNDAGWKVNPNTGHLEKDGIPFIINFLTRSPSSAKFLFIYKESLEDVGIQLKITQKDWAAWMKDMDDFNYDMTWAAWGAGTIKDPEPMWHSSTANLKSSNNITGFKNKEVDKLIDQTKEIFNVEKRHDIIRKIDSIIYSEVPYILLWHIDYTRLLYWNKFGTPSHIIGKFSDEWAALDYWWSDPIQSEDLDNAIKNNKTLPKVKRNIYFDKEFTELKK